jgi:hypothetical protein
MFARNTAGTTGADRRPQTGGRTPEDRGRIDPPQSGRREAVLLGSAGQRIITAGEILCLAGLTAGLNTTQKNEYNITVCGGPPSAS